MRRITSTGPFAGGLFHDAGRERRLDLEGVVENRRRQSHRGVLAEARRAVQTSPPLEHRQGRRAFLTCFALGSQDHPQVAALIFLARVQAGQQKLDEALSVADRAAAQISQKGAHPVATLASTRGDILARMGRNHEAEAAFREEIAHFSCNDERFRTPRAAARVRTSIR